MGDVGQEETRLRIFKDRLSVKSFRRDDKRDSCATEIPTFSA
jgi:hypothetical protein